MFAGKIHEKDNSITKHNENGQTVFQGRTISKGDRDALTRYESARQALQRLADKSLSSDERKKLKTLSNTNFVFFAGKGYKNFHTIDCPKLKNLPSLTGITSYNAAIAKRLTPCKVCRPHPSVYSIPTNNADQGIESNLEIVKLFKEKGYDVEFDLESSLMIITTPVGKWSMRTDLKPVHLQHINFLYGQSYEAEFHNQPRVFLSLMDAYKYIVKHDTKLEKNGVRFTHLKKQF